MFSAQIYFKIYINDIVQYITRTNGIDPVSVGQTNLNCLLYAAADDIVLISRSKHGLQKCLNAVNEFSQAWHMPINTQKSNIQQKQQIYMNENFSLGGIKLDCVRKRPA